MNLALPDNWVVRDLLPKGGLWMIAGAPKAGKSYLVTELSHCLVNKEIDFFHGYKVEYRGPVLYINYDMPTSSHKRRYQLLEQNHGYNFQGMYHICMDEIPPGFNILKEGSREWLKSQVADLKPSVIIFDVIRRFYVGDENNSDVCSQFIQSVNDILQESSASGILLHHSNKTSEAGQAQGFEKDPISAVRGSSVIAGSMDTICAFNNAGNQLWYQGRDISTKYTLKREKNGLPNRWIRKNNNNLRREQTKMLGAGYLLQVTNLGKDDVYNLMLTHVEDYVYEEFEQDWPSILTQFKAYE